MNAQTKTIGMGHGLLPNPVLTAGEGTPLVYLHGLYGQEWDSFVDGLSTQHQVWAPAHVGIQDADELKLVTSMYELVLYYDTLFRKLGLQQIDLVGHSFGGMVAAELAAVYPERVRSLVLIDPIGLWRDDAPVGDYLLCTDQQRARLLLGDPASDAVKQRLALPEDAEARIKMTLDRVSTLAATSHYLWPIPERGLKKRLHRITSKTLIVWGEQDQLVPCVHAQDFASKIDGARVHMVAGAGHTPQFSQPEKVLDTVLTFLAR